MRELIAAFDSNDVDTIGNKLATLSDNVKDAYIFKVLDYIFTNNKHNFLPVVYNEISDISQYNNIKTYIAENLGYFPDEFNLNLDETIYYAAFYGNSNLFDNVIKNSDSDKPVIQEEVITTICKSGDIEKYKILLNYINDSQINTLVDSTLSALSAIPNKSNKSNIDIFYLLFNYVDINKISKEQIKDFIVYLKLYGINYSHIVKLLKVCNELDNLHGEISDDILINLAANGYDIVKLKLVDDYSLINDMNDSIIDSSSICKDVVKIIMSY